MKQQTKKTISLILSCLMVFSLFAGLDVLSFAETQGVLTYEISNGTATITDCDTSAKGTLVVPDTIDGYPVTAIGFAAFSGCSDLSDVILPNSVTSLGKSAFLHCSSLRNVTLSKNITSIPDFAFSGCSDLRSIQIPSGVVSIGADAFCNCENLGEVSIPASVTSIVKSAFSLCTGITYFAVDQQNEYYSNDEYGVLFNKDKTTILHYACGRTDATYNIPATVTSIQTYAFYGSKNLTYIDIPDGVEEIGDHAFEDCSLTGITFPETLTKFSDWIFRGNPLTSVTIDKNNPYYCTDESGVIFNKDKTMLLYYPEGKTETSYVIPSGVQTIGSRAFYTCSNLTSIKIPNTVTKIGLSTFRDCTGLTSIRIPKSVTTIESAAFCGCTNLQSVTIPETVTTIGSEAFGYICVSYKFSPIADFTVCGKPDTAAEEYAVKNGFRFVEVEDDPEIMKGDINGDGKISAVDARLALRYAAQLTTLTDEQLLAADVNGDDKVSAVDARVILRVAANLQTIPA